VEARIDWNCLEVFKDNWKDRKGGEELGGAFQSRVIKSVIEKFFGK